MRLFVLSCAMGIMFGQFAARAQPSESTEQETQSNVSLTELQAWVDRRIAAGETADIKVFLKENHLEISGDPKTFLTQRGLVLPEEFIKGLLVTQRGPESHLSVVHIENAAIQALTLPGVEIPMAVNLSHCFFLNEVDFSESNLHKSVTFEYSHFSDRVSFHLATMGGDLNLDYTHFDKDQAVDFRGIKVKGRMVLANSQFAGGAWFHGAEINSDLDLKYSQFRNPQASTVFRDMKIGGDFLLLGVQQPGMDKGLMIFDTEVTFENTRVDGSFKTSDGTRFNNVDIPARFTNMKVGTAQFSVHSFKGKPPILSGMTYDSLDMFENDKNGESLLQFLRQTEYRADVYARVEAFLKNNGQAQLADSVFIERNIREAEGLPWYSRLWSFFLRVFVGYGRKPWLAFFWWFAVVGFGFAMFRKKDWMALTDKKAEGQEGSRHYNPFWYSLDLFAPVIDLGFAKLWEPSPQHPHRQLARQYVQIHKILGWILVPIGVAAMTGYLK